MLKLIPASQLRVGMYVRSFPGTWRLSSSLHPPFLLEKDEDLQAIQSSRIREVVIDTARGADVATAEAVPSASRPSAVMAERAPASMQTGGSVDLQVERERAAHIITAAEQAVISMFEQARMGQAVDLGQARDLVSEITASVSRNADALVSLVRLKTADNYTYMHSVAVCAMMISLSNQLCQTSAQREQVGMAGLLHDIGKMCVPTEILNKAGPLSEVEFAVVRSHALAGHDLLKELPGIGKAPLDVCLHHHEKIDGSGYPGRLAGEAITVWSRMGAVCDVYDAITSDRPYKSGWDPARSLQHMARSKGHFDFEILQAFVRAVGIYPIGSCVLMKSGHVAIVLDQRPGHLLEPLVRVFHATGNSRRITPFLLDLRHSSDRIVGHVDPERIDLPHGELSKVQLNLGF